MLFCRRCRHRWNSRLLEGKPKRCPRCTSPAWFRNLKQRGRKKGTVMPKRQLEIPIVTVTIPVDPELDQTREVALRVEQAREILRRINA